MSYSKDTPAGSRLGHDDPTMESFADKDARIDALVAALRRITQECDGAEIGSIFDPRKAAREAVKIARAALAAVDKEPE